MKKATAFVCMIVLCTALSACGKDNTGNNANNAQQTESTVTGSGTEVPADGNGAGQETAGNESGTDAAGEETGSAAWEETDPGDIQWSEEMQSIRQAVVDALGENYWPDYAITPEMLEGTFGVSADLYDDYMGESPMISANVDTLIVIKAKEGKVQEVEEALNAYRDMLVGDTMQYPMNLGKIQASRIDVSGNYVSFVQLGADTTDYMEQGDEAVIEYCLEQNELAIEVIRSAVVK